MAIRLLPRAAAAIAVAATAACAQAASPGCAKAATSMERAICASPELSALDGQIARNTQRALKSLSPRGADLLRQSQLAWRRFVAQTCAAPEDGRPEPRCLENELTSRSDQLQGAGIRLGAWTFNRIDQYKDTPSTPADGNPHPGLATFHIAYPQIDAPRTPAEVAWNAARARSTTTDAAAPDTDVDADYQIGCAGPRILSLRLSTSTYGHGAAHGNWAYQTSNAVLPGLRPMDEGDLFMPDSGWRERLPELFWQAWQQGDHVIRDRPEIEPAVRQAAVDPGHWLLTPQGLEIAFSAYEAGCYACDPGQLTVPWSALKSMLASPEVAACKGPPPVKR